MRLVQNHHVPRPLDYLLSVLDELGMQPSHPVAPNRMHISGASEGVKALLSATNNANNTKVAKMIPSLNFIGPYLPGYALRRDDEHLPGIEGVVQIGECGER